MKFDPPLVKSLSLHFVVVASLFVSVDFTADDMPMPSADLPVIQATFIDAQAIADREREERRVAEEKRKKEQDAAAAKRRAEQKRREQREAEKKRQQELKRERELKKKAAEEVKRKREEAEAKKREAAEKAAEDKRQRDLDKLMEEQMAAERRAQQKRRSQQILTEVDKYRVQIQQTIMRYLVEDPDFKGKTCRLNIRLASTGLVSKVSIIEGEPALCRAAQSAVLRPDKLPVSDDPDVYEQLKNINLTVKLENL